MRALADTVPLFAPEVEVRTLPGWDCLPYDRASPALRVMAERLATLSALQVKREAAQLLVATASAATQRLLTPFRIRQLTRQIAVGELIEREGLIEQLNSLGYQRVDTVAEHGEYSVRGSLIDLFPAGEDQALQLDFFGDEVESLRRLILPTSARPTSPRRPRCCPRQSLARPRRHQALPLAYREKLGATATSDPLYQALSDGRRIAGMEHRLPLFEDRLATLFDHLGDSASSSATPRPIKRLASVARRSRIITKIACARWRASPGSYRPLEPHALYLSKKEWESAEADQPIHLATPFHEPGSECVIEFGVEISPRLRARASAAGERLRSGSEACR